MQNKYALDNILTLGVFLSNIRLMFHLSVFSSQFRSMLTVIVNAINQLAVFIVILFMFIGLMSVSSYTINEDDQFLDTIIANYMIMFG